MKKILLFALILVFIVSIQAEAGNFFNGGGGSGSGSMTYPGAGVGISTGSAWDTSKTTPTGDFVGTTDSQTLTNKDLSSGTNTFPTLNQNTTGTAGNLSGTPALPDGTTATTQTAGDKSTKLATTAYADLPKTGQAVTCTDSGDANHGALTITPTAGLSGPIYVTNNDAHGCTITMDETGAVDGQTIVIHNVSANHIDFATSAGVVTLTQGTPFACAQNEILKLQYRTNTWVEVGRATGTITGAVFGGFTASAGMVPLTDASGDLVNSYVAISGPTTAIKTITVDDASQTLAARNRDNSFTGANTIGDGGDDQKIVMRKNASDGTWSGMTLQLTAHENVAFGQLVFINSDGEAALADADAAATMPAVAIVVVAANADATCTVLTHGTVTETDWAWTAGQVLYVSETAGSIENTVGNISDTNDVVQKIGVALTGDTILFMPSLTTIVLE